MYSLPTSTTFAALTIASAASIDPMSPLVSTMPSASRFIPTPLRRTALTAALCRSAEAQPLRCLGRKNAEPGPAGKAAARRSTVATARREGQGGALAGDAASDGVFRAP